jgi:3-isopropylmalate/(R)-2-methylmalate dehydratase small subunit
VERTGFGEFLFFDWKHEDFYILDRPEYEGARILVAGRNFGCGSSREHAVLALRGAGIAAVIAESAARIFFRNAINLALPVIVAPEAARALAAGEGAEIDIAAGVIRQGAQSWRFPPFQGEVAAIITAGGLAARVRATLAAPAPGG